MLLTISALIVSLVVMFIAWLQWRVAYNKFRLDLFDRRYKVYDTARTFLSAITSEPNFNNQELLTFEFGKSVAVFLFKADVVDYLTQVRTRALDMRQSERDLQPGQTHLSWLVDRFTEIDKVFEPYLGFTKVKQGRF